MNNLMHTENGKHLLETTETIVGKNSLQRVNSTEETNAPASQSSETKIQQPLHPERSNRYKMVKIQEKLEDENEANACETGGEMEIAKIEVSLNQSSKISPPRQASGKNHYCLPQRLENDHEFDRVQLNLKSRIMPTENVSKALLPKVRRTKQTQNRHEGINQTKCQNNIYCGLKRKVPSDTAEEENLNSEKPKLHFENRGDKGPEIKIIKKSQSLNAFRFKELVMKKIKTQNDLSLDLDKIDDPFDLGTASSLRMKKSRSVLKPIFSFCPPAPHNTTKFYCQLRELPSLPNFNKIDEVSEEESDSFIENSPDTCESMCGLVNKEMFSYL